MSNQRGIPYIESHWKRIYHYQRKDVKKGTGIDIYKFKLKMANTLSVMTNVLRNVVSKKRIRYKEKGFNLDLAYIVDNIMAMGYPADSIESMYRNRLEDVYKFLEENHHNHYKIYNLCLERSYDINRFHGRVAVYPFEDHNPPTIELILKFCEDVDSWLKADGLNVAAVHCKAGKGRTGTMICCYLVYSGQQSTADDALSCYDEKRTKDRKGVTIPSQRRYVQYFSKLIRSGLSYEKRTLQFCEIRFTETNLLHSHGTLYCSISVLQDSVCAVKVQNLSIDFRKSFTLYILNPTLLVGGDVKVELTHKTSRKKIFHFWFNTFFVADEAVVEGKGCNSKIIYTLHKCEIDDAHKDKEHKCFSENFKVQLVFYAESSHETNDYDVTNRISNIDTQSGRSHNSSSRSGLNCVGDQNSSSSVSSLGEACCEVIVYEENRDLQKIDVGNIHPTLAIDAPPLPLSPPPTYAHFNDIGLKLKQYPKTQHQHVNTAVTATSMPHQKHPHEDVQAYPISQRQQQYQPCSNAPKIDRENNSHGKSSCQAFTSNSNLQFSSHSSSSAIGDNDVNRESGESPAKPIASNTLMISPLKSATISTHSSSIPASNIHTSFCLNLHSKSSNLYNNKIAGDEIENFKTYRQNAVTYATFTASDEYSCSCISVVSTNDALPNSIVAYTKQSLKPLVLSNDAPTTRPKLMQLLLAPKTTASTEKHIFRRKSFKSSVTVSNDSSALQVEPSSTMPGCSSNSNCVGLATTSKQKLKIKLKKNQRKLSQKFQWFQSYFRTDPVDFRQNFEEQTTPMRRNSTCSLASRSRKLSITTPPPKKLSYSTPSCPNLAKTKNVKLNSNIKSLSTSTSSTSTVCNSTASDYYSSICDNQLSFKNSPCRSPAYLEMGVMNSFQNASGDPGTQIANGRRNVVVGFNVGEVLNTNSCLERSGGDAVTASSSIYCTPQPTFDRSSNEECTKSPFVFPKLSGEIEKLSTSSEVTQEMVKCSRTINCMRENELEDELVDDGSQKTGTSASCSQSRNCDIFPSECCTNSSCSCCSCNPVAVELDHHIASKHFVASAEPPQRNLNCVSAGNTSERMVCELNKVTEDCT